MSQQGYELFYWPSIPGRGEFVRLLLEYAHTRYTDVARDRRKDGVAVMMRYLAGGEAGFQPFAPPFLKHGKLIVAQTSNILQYLGPRHGLVPKSNASRVFAHQIQLTIADLVNEAHDVHHPIGVSLYYEDQRPEAMRRSVEFRERRLPKFLGYLERLLEREDAKGFLGNRTSYVDLSAFQVVAGLAYAFPRAMKKEARRMRRLRALHDRIAEDPRLAGYLGSARRLPFNESGIFRYYPELDTPRLGG